MIPTPLSELVSASGGVYFGDAALLAAPVSDIRINSRAVRPGEVFVPVSGARFDGHRFLNDARQNGALCVLSEHPLDSEPYLLVPDAVDALQRIAAAYRARFPIPLVGITGSMGKTSVKEMTAAVLEQKYRVHKSLGNKNNQTGVPLMLFALDPVHEISVMELGTNHFGEIASLSRMTRPSVCVFTNIGVSHIETLGSREGILKAKLEMLDYAAPGRRVIVNGDDDLLCRIPDTFTFGLSPHCDVRAEHIRDLGLDGVAFTALCDGQALPVRVPVPARCTVLNALAALAVGLQLNIPLPLIQSALESFTPPAGRMDVKKRGRMTVIDDTYNSNPTSVMAAIDVLVQTAGRHVCILGDMLELGADSEEFHEVTGMYAARHGVDLILCVGPKSEKTYRAAVDLAPGRVRHFPDQQALQQALPALLREDDTVLVKASRGMFLENTVRFLLGPA